MNHTPPDLRILIRGANDIGSAVAHYLFKAGYAVAIHEDPKPTTARRKMSFTDAVYGGEAMLDGVQANRVENLSSLRGLLVSHSFIPVLIGDFFRLIEKLRPQVLVDARMRKHTKPVRQIHLAPLTIGLGPNFSTGINIHLAIETAWGADLGCVIQRGGTNPLEGEPKPIEGHARDRYVYAPFAGTFRTSLQIGDKVESGEVVARIDSTPLLAPIAGFLRGLTRDNVPVSLRTKVIEVDPRKENAQVSGIGERPARIAEGVVTAIQSWEANHVH